MSRARCVSRLALRLIALAAVVPAAVIVAVEVVGPGWVATMCLPRPLPGDFVGFMSALVFVGLGVCFVLVSLAQPWLISTRKVRRLHVSRVAKVDSRT